MLTLHHLNNSRSQRILWLLEELEVNYEIRHYQRDPDTSRAPAELKAIHPMGKSPVITDGDNVIAETGAIIVYILDNYGKGRLRPEEGTQEYIDYVHFLHFAEGSAMLPFLLALYTGFLGDAAAPLNPMIMQEIKGVLDYCEYQLIGHEYFAGDELTGADIQMIFPLEAARARGRLKGYDACNEYVDKIHKRPAYLRGLERGATMPTAPNKPSKRTLAPFHMAAPILDKETVRAFYVDILGCSVGREAETWIDLDFFGHQVSFHVKPEAANENKLTNPVDGKDVPVRHFGVILDWDEWQGLADRVKAAKTMFIIEPYVRFQGETGEQATMFFLDPSGNALEFKSFKDTSQIFAS